MEETFNLPARMTREEFFAAAPPHGVAAVKNGGTFFDGKHSYNLENLGFDMAAMEGSAVDAAVDAAQKDVRIAELEQRIAELEKSTTSTDKPKPLDKAAVEAFAVENDLVVLNKADHEALTAEIETLKSQTPEEAAKAEALKLADAVLGASKTAIERLPEDALQIMAKLKGIEEVPEGKADLVAVLKPEGN